MIPLVLLSLLAVPNCVSACQRAQAVCEAQVAERCGVTCPPAAETGSHRHLLCLDRCMQRGADACHACHACHARARRQRRCSK